MPAPLERVRYEPCRILTWIFSTPAPDRRLVRLVSVNRRQELVLTGFGRANTPMLRVNSMPLRRGHIRRILAHFGAKWHVLAWQVRAVGGGPLGEHRL